MVNGFGKPTVRRRSASCVHHGLLFQVCDQLKNLVVETGSLQITTGHHLFTSDQHHHQTICMYVCVVGMDDDVVMNPRTSIFH
jgi:hypothetical protein